MQILRQSTAIDVRVGPAVDAIDGVSPEVGITIAAADQADILKADGAATVTMAGTLAAVTNVDGWYDYTMSTGDTDTVGTLDLVLQDSSVMLPVFVRFQVLDAVSYDAIYAASPTILTDKDIGQLFESTIATVTSQTEFICDVAIVSDDNWIGQIITIEDVSTGEAVARWITDVVQSTETIIINSAPPFTVAVADIVRVESRVHATFAIENYDPPTRAELSSDTSAILAQITAIFTTQMTEAYAADGVAPTPAQALMLIQQLLGDFAIAATTLTVRKIDGATTAATFTLDDSTNPTASTRAT